MLSLRQWSGLAAFRVSCDMKLLSVLLGGVILTKPCVCPQVLHGSMRLMGGVRESATVRGVKPSRQCSEPGSLKPGDALESEDKVKPVNARKHRQREPSHTRLFKAGAKMAGSRVRVV